MIFHGATGPEGPIGATGPAVSYLTSEILTGGTWIDSKPIYRKVIPFTATSSETSLDINHNLSIAFYLKADIVNLQPLIASDRSSIAPLSGLNENVTLLASTSGNIIRTDTNSIGFDGIYCQGGLVETFYLILEYTKTTD